MVSATASTSQKQPAADLQTELQEVKFTMKKMKEEEDVEIIEIRHRREKTILMKKIRELKEFVRSLKMKNNNLKKDREERMEIQEKLQEEVQTLRAINNELQKKYETVMGNEVKLRMELERMKIANDKLNKYWESKMDCEEEKEIPVIRNHEPQRELEAIKTNVRVERERVKIAKDDPNKYWESKMDCEEEKEIHVIRKQEPQKELEAIKTNVPVQNLQLVGSSSQSQRGRQRAIDTADDGKMSLHDFQLIRKLGEGAFGKVLLAKGKLLGGPEQLYAVKALKKQIITSRNMRGIMAEKEALMLTRGHPFITTLYGCFQNKDSMFFVMEFMSGGDLNEQLNEVKFFSEERSKFYAAEVTVAVQFLHQRGILHRDLKLENVLVGNDGHCKVADFGLSKLGLLRHCKARTQCGTPFCLAPEIVKNLPYGQGVDWWAVGIMIFQMITGHPPFYCDEEEDMDVNYAQYNLYQKIVNNEVAFPEDMSLDAVSIVTQLLMKNPEQRLGSNGSVDTVRQHPFFKGIDWQSLYEKRVKPPEKEKVSNKTQGG